MRLWSTVVSQDHTPVVDGAALASVYGGAAAMVAIGVVGQR